VGVRLTFAFLHERSDVGRCLIRNQIEDERPRSEREFW
jgi:hypothetical protein